MNKLLIPAAALTILAAPALAAGMHATGTVKSVDRVGHTLTLTDGTTYSLPTSFKDPGLEAGTKVSVNWEKVGMKNMADEVTITK